MAVATEVKTRRVDAHMVTTHPKDRPGVQQTEVLRGRGGELRLGIPAEITGLDGVSGQGLPTVHGGIDSGRSANRGPTCGGSCPASCPPCV